MIEARQRVEERRPFELGIVEIELLLVELADRLIEQRLRGDHLALIVAQHAERGPHRAIVGMILEQLLEILARIAIATGRTPHAVQHQMRFDRDRVFADRDRRDRRFGTQVIAGRELCARDQDPCGRAVLAADLAELDDRRFVVARDELVATGGEVCARQVRRRAQP